MIGTTATSVHITEMNVVGWNKVDERWIPLNAWNAPGGYILPPLYRYEGHIVQWNGDTKAQKTAWLVVRDNGELRRRWIPDIPTYNCLKAHGAPGPDVLAPSILDQLRDETGVKAECGGGGGAPPPPPSPQPPPAPQPPPQPPPQPQPQPPPPTWNEQESVNHAVNTFLNYHNASGVGPAIAAAQWVQVSCKVYDPAITSVNPDGYWYRIASAPWNNSYYAPANTFMNGDPPGGPYTHNTDFAVADC